MRTRWIQIALIAVGLFIALYPVTLGAGAELTCRGVVMRPGDSCAKADHSQAQTYEQRLADRRGATPVVIVLGLVVAGFGSALLWSDRRHAGEAQPTSRLIGP